MIYWFLNLISAQVVVDTLPDTHCFCAKPDMPTPDRTNYVTLHKAMCNGECEIGSYPINTSMCELKLDLKRCKLRADFETCLCVEMEVTSGDQFLEGEVYEVE